MIYLLLGGISAFFGLSSGIGATTLLRPLLDAVSPLAPDSIAALCAMTTLGAALVSAFFALNRPLVLYPEEMVLLGVGAAMGGVLGDLAAWRFMTSLGESSVLLQNALLFTLLALPTLYFAKLAGIVRPLSLSRYLSMPVALLVGTLGSFLSFGAEPLCLALYFLLFDAADDEAWLAALTVALFAMLGKLVTLLVRQRLFIPAADALIWLLPGALLGAIAACVMKKTPVGAKAGGAILSLSLFTSLVNMAAAAL